MYKITNKIRLIELFAGVGSQAMALRNIGADFEHYITCEWWVQSFASYKAIHCADDNKDYSEFHSKQYLIKLLFEMGISNDGKNPMTLEQIKKKPEQWLRETYNNICATNNIVNIMAAKGQDLRIEETNKYTYVLTYSFPCQDLSVAGKMKGMDKGSGTRSGMLWEVERLLNEVQELPQVLLMENVPQVMQKKNMHNFLAWQQFLESKGYENHAEILNAKDYGIAQNRQRAFMVSILGGGGYKFPKAIPLTKTMKDYLEEEVDKKYYINSEKAQKLIETLIADNKIAQKSESGLSVIGSLNPKKECQDRVRVFSSDGISPGLRATDYKDPTKIVKSVLQIGNIAEESTFSNSQIGRVYDSNGCAPTLNTCGGGSHEPKTIVAMRGRNPDNPSDKTLGNHVEQRLEPNIQGICNTLTSVQKDNMLLESAILTPKRTEYGKKIRKLYEIGAIKESRHNMTQLEPRTDGVSNTLTTVQKDNMLLETVRIKQATKEGYIDCKIGGFADLSYPTSDTRRGRVQDNGDTCPTITAAETGICKIESEYRIRKLTPREYWRLMGFSDEDFDKAAAVNSNTQLYSQAGNSIVVNVLEGIFKQMIQPEEHEKEITEGITIKEEVKEPTKPVEEPKEGHKKLKTVAGFNINLPFAPDSDIKKPVSECQ